MRLRFNSYNAIILVTLSVMFLYAHPARAQGCPGDQGRFDVLSINVLFSEPGKPLSDRLKALTEQLKTLIDNAVIAVPDAILVQELTRGVLAESGAKDSPELLGDLLEQTLGEHYTHKTTFETGIPFLFSTANAIYVRAPCEILVKLVKFLPAEETVTVGSLKIPVTRNVMMVLVNANGNLLSLYNTHLCAEDCTDEQRKNQNDAALAFIDNVENFLDSSDLDSRSLIYGGDLNSDLFRGKMESETFGPQKSMIYDKIIAAGFIDGYFEGQLNAMTVERLSDLCPNNPPVIEAGAKHCTIGVTPLSLLDPRQRIDYVFFKHFANPVMSRDTMSTVIFNALADPTEPDADISDHAGVFVGAKLP
jgi:endonuclease/exonuclease/phosphatase family metal-dependent hydrolase